jgi:protein-tyrosine phosphatase
MVDIHCHILPYIDDGAASLDVSKEMAVIATNDGIESIVATPHYIEYENEISKNDILNACNNLNDFLYSNQINLNIIPGCEAFISPSLPQKYKDGKMMSINNIGKHVLIELPVRDYPEYTEDVIFDFKLMGITPIIAHIERYLYVTGDFHIIYKLIKLGALTQVNSTSITGLFGEEFKYKAIELIKCNMVHFIASDAHTARGRSPKISNALSYLKENGVDEEYIKFLIGNSSKIINAIDINIPEPILMKKRKFIDRIFKRRF